MICIFDNNKNNCINACKKKCKKTSGLIFCYSKAKMTDFSMLAHNLTIQNDQDTENTTTTTRVNFAILKRQKIDFNLLPDKVFIRIFSFLKPNFILKCSLVSKHWHKMIQNPKLWRLLRLRSDFDDSIQVKNFEHFAFLLNQRFSQALEYIELPVDFITPAMLHDLANKCSHLKYLTLDFSAAMQLQDFNDLNSFPCNLKMLTVYLSEVIFLEGFMRRIYGSFKSLEQLHLVGTLESSNDPDEAYETINLVKLKGLVPNLRVLNLYGMTFIEDFHVEALASTCIHLECIALNYCSKFKGHSLKNILNRCKKISCLLLQNTAIEDEAMKAINWQETLVQELDLTATDLSADTLVYILLRLDKISYLSVANCDGFTDQVLETLIDHKKFTHIRVLDMGNIVNVGPEAAFLFIRKYGSQLQGFVYTGNPKVTEQFWISSIVFLKKIKIISLGTPLGWFINLQTRVHINQIMENFALNFPFLEQLEIQWDSETIRFNENSRKSVDHIRLRCPRLKSIALSDGEYYEMVRSNFERADRYKCVRLRTQYLTSTIKLVSFYSQLNFN